MSVLLLSGGLDSTVLLADCLARGDRPDCLTFHYGQRHARETEAAQAVAARYGVHHRILALPAGVFAGSALTGAGDIPYGHHEDASMKLTVVPNRNAVFLSIAAALATGAATPRVLFAAHAGDRAIYPDCRASFVAAFGHATTLACGVRVEAPFLTLTKADVVRRGRELDAPFHLTWTCYLGGDRPCGKCGACTERREAGA